MVLYREKLNTVRVAKFDLVVQIPAIPYLFLLLHALCGLTVGAVIVCELKGNFKGTSVTSLKT
jgi:hypothetical protein